MQVIAINRKDLRFYWVSKYNSLTLNFDYSLKTDDIHVIKDIIKRYKKGFKLIVLTDEGEVIKLYG